MANNALPAITRGTFDPRMFSSLALWLDADDPSTITTSSGQVTQWLDKSSNALAFTRGTGSFDGPRNGPALATYNGRTVLSFNGTNTVLRNATIPGLGKRTMFFVIVPTATPGSTSIFFDYYPMATGSISWVPTVEFGYTPAGNFSYFKRATSSGAVNNSVPGAGLNNAAIMRVTYDDTTFTVTNFFTFNLKAAANRATVLSGAGGLLDGSQQGQCVGARNGVISGGYYSNFFTGHVAEILVFNDTLPAKTVTDIEDYLARKWGIPLPTTVAPITAPTDISNCSFWVDASDISSLKQDSAGTTAVTASGQTVAYWADKSGANQHVINAGGSSVCPTYVLNRQNGKPVLSFDGGDSLLSAADRTTTAPATVIVACRDRGTISTVAGVLTTGNSTGGEGGPGIYSNAAQYIADGPGGNTTTSSNTATTNHVAVFTTVAAVYTQANTKNSYIYRDGGLEEYFTGTGVALGSHTRVQVGGRTGSGVSSRVFIGDIAECIIYDRALTTTELMRVFKYLNDKWGVGATRPTSSHPEVQDWIDRAYYNSGAISQYTVDCVTEFCRRIDTAGLRSKFYRLNLFCGNNLAACLTPLYRGPVPLARNFGGAYDRTANYSSGASLVGSGFYNSPNEYVESGALTTTGLTGASAGNTRTVYTGFFYNELPTLLNAHFASFFRVNTTPSSAAYAIGGLIAGTEQAVNFQQVRMSVEAPTTAGFNLNVAISGTNLASVTNVPLGAHFVVASRTSATSLTAYVDGASSGTNATTTANYVSPYVMSVVGSANGANTGGAFPYPMGAYSAGLGLTAAETAAYTRFMQNFQLQLGRNDSNSAYASAHPEAQNWYARVVRAGGDASATTLTAVSNFCKAVDSAGIRNKFYRLNLFCGGGLIACRTPLYTHPGNGVLYGNAIDINLNYGGSAFVAANYTESTGLRGTGTTIGPYLDTGLRGNMITPANSLHGMAVVLEESTQTGAYFGVAAQNSVNIEAVSRGGYFNTTFSTAANAPAGSAPEMLTFVRSSRSNIVAYRNTTAGTPNTSTIEANPFSPEPIAIFARLIHSGNGVTLFHNGRLGGYSFGTALTAAEVSAYYTAMQTFQAAIGRTI